MANAERMFQENQFVHHQFTIEHDSRKFLSNVIYLEEFDHDMVAKRKLVNGKFAWPEITACWC